MIIIMSLYFYYLVCMIYGIGKIYLYPSTNKYCDNNYKKCEYFQANGILVSNVINEKYDNFNVQYLLSSSYNWTAGSSSYNLHNKKNKNKNRYGICHDLETHIYDSHLLASTVKEKSIGDTKNIFVSYSISSDCKLKYKWYSPNKLYFFLSCQYSVYIMLFFMFMLGCFQHRYINANGDIQQICPGENIIERIINVFILIIYMACASCFIFSMFSVVYFAINYN